MDRKNVLSSLWTVVFSTALLALSAVDISAQTRVVPESRAEVQLSVSPVVKQAAPAVVNIFTKAVVTSRASMFDQMFGNDPFFGDFFGRQGRPTRRSVENSLGSGVILSEGGLVVTNSHVIKGASEIRVVTNDRREYDAELLFEDRDSDLAFLQIDAGGEKLPSLELANSDEVEVGDFVIAIGNPFGVGQTVTSGILSALDRSGLSGAATGGFFLQTDAAINPGNSGGALVGLDGKLMGINTAIFSRSGGSNGIGFAIPANLVAAYKSAVEKGEQPRLPWLGFVAQTVDADLAEGMGLPRSGGLIINELFTGGPASSAGLRPGDVILEVERQEIVDDGGFNYRLRTAPPDKPLEITIWRNGKRLMRSLARRPAPEQPSRNETVVELNSPMEGAIVLNLSPAVSEELELPGEWSGVVIERAYRGSPAARLGFRPRDIIVSVNGNRIENVTNLLDALNNDGRDWNIALKRNGRVTSYRLRY